MSKGSVFGVVFFQKDATPLSFFGVSSVRSVGRKERTQVQILVTRETRGDLYSVLRFPKGYVLPRELTESPVSGAVFQRLMGDPQVIAVFGAQLGAAGAEVIHPTLAAVVEESDRLCVLAHHLLKESVTISEIFKDLAGGIWAQAKTAGGEPVYLFYRSAGALFRGAAGWYVELTGASHVDIHLCESDLEILKDDSSPNLFGVPIRSIRSDEVLRSCT